MSSHYGKIEHLLWLQNQIQQAADNQRRSYHDNGGFKHISDAQLSSQYGEGRQFSHFLALGTLLFYWQVWYYLI